jgi:hypothetical protein
LALQVEAFFSRRGASAREHGAHAAAALAWAAAALAATYHVCSRAAGQQHPRALRLAAAVDTPFCGPQLPACLTLCMSWRRDPGGRDGSVQDYPGGGAAGTATGVARGVPGRRGARRRQAGAVRGRRAGRGAGFARGRQSGGGVGGGVVGGSGGGCCGTGANAAMLDGGEEGCAPAAAHATGPAAAPRPEGTVESQANAAWRAETLGELMTAVRSGISSA